MEEADELGSIVQVVLGKDYTGTIRPPVPFGDEITNVAASTEKTQVALPSDLEHMNAADDICK